MFAILFLSRQPRSAGQWLAVVLLLTWFILPKHSLAQCFQRTDYPVGRNAISIGVGDFNRDGKADLAVANRRPYLNDSGFGDQGPEASIYRLLNNGAGSFGSGISYLIERKNSQFGELFAIGISDFNADGKPDLVANEYLNKFDVVSGDGSGFGGSIQDYPLDGFLEGNFYPRTVVVGDFNADGRPDVATADDNNHQPRIAVLLNNETGGFSERAFYNYGGRYEYSGFSGYDVQSLAVVDLNADGYPDLVALYREYISVLLNNRLGGFNPAVSSRNPDGDYLSSVASGDFNADGRPDVVMTVSNKDYVRVAFGDGRGGFDYITPVRVGANGPKSVKVGDFNGDGEDDIVTANSDSQNVSVLMGTGSYSFATPILIPLGVPSNFLEVGDFNGDRRTDIVTANRESQTISVLIGTAPPAAPSLLTINGQSYPGSQSAVTVSQNSGGVLLLGGCSSGILNWSGSDGRHGRSNSSGNVTIIVPTSATGAFSYTASCEIGTCTSPTAVATVTVTPPPPVPFAITGVTDVLCVSDGNNVRRISFTPQYTGLTGQPITFSVRNELSPTTAFGPYALRVYTDNPTITLQAMQGGTAGMTTFDYNWLAACATPLPALNIRYVKPLTSGTGDGSSWANASGDLRAMLRASAPGNQVWVAAGTYKPTTGTDRTLSFNVPSGVQVYGNFAGTETSLSQRQLSYPLRTVLSGNIGDPAPSVFDNTYHVVTFQNVAAGTLLDGFVVRDGGTGSNTEFPVPPGGYTGAGIYNGSSSGQTSSPTVQNCYVTHNRGAFAGGGMFNGGTGTATLVNCLFSGNYGEHGGAIFSSFRFAGPGDILSNFTVNIINCSLVSNGSDQEGKAIAGGRLNIRNSIIRYNHGRSHLSAIQNNDYTDSHISYSIVQENSSSGIYVGGTVRNVDPQFISLDGTNPDYRLQATSPAINTGDPYGTGLPPTDLAGSARVAGGRVDMGAFEFGSTLPASGLTLLVPTYDCSSGAFTFRTSGGDGRSIEYQAPSITGWSTNPNQLVDRETRIACDAPPVTLQARYVGEPASEVTLVWNIRAVCPTCGSSSGSFAITGVTSISCVISGPTERRLTFTPQYSGINGQPITFSVYNELVPTTVAGPYTLRLYTDNPTITLQAQQGGTPGTSSFAYNWLATCAMGARQGFMTEENEPELIVKVLGTPTHGEEVAIEITGVVGQSLRLTSTDVQGRVFEDLSVKMAHSREKYWLKVGSQSGLYFLRVTTSRLIQTVKVVKQ